MTDLEFSLASDLSERVPDAQGGVLAVTNLASTAVTEQLEVFLEGVELTVRNRYGQMTRAELRDVEPMAAYERYYRSFGQHYHVTMQIESVAIKNKPLPRRLLPVEIAFAHELLSGILTAVHDLNDIAGDVELQSMEGEVKYTLYNGTETAIKPKDLYFSDEAGVLSSIVQGPCQRATISDQTRSMLVTAYGVSGVSAEQLRTHLEAIWNTVHEIDPGAVKLSLEVKP
jgi:DNA/RNA-binding domain of Phe-tRNA-synthetase-like protein